MKRRIMFLGDSITAGQYIDPQERFSYLLENSELSRDSSFIFEAISGQTSRQALLTFPEKLYFHRPHFLIIQLGINDGNIWKSEGGVHPRVSIGAFRENLREIVERSRIAEVGLLRFITNHTLKKNIDISGEIVNLQSQNEIYNSVIKEVGAILRDGIYDLATFWSQIDSSNKFEPLLLADGVHLSALGHRIYGDFLFNQISADLKKSESFLP